MKAVNITVGMHIDEEWTVTSVEYALSNLLPAPPGHIHIADIGVLVWPGVEESSMELVGWTSRVHLATYGEIMDFGNGKRLVLPHTKMLSMEHLQSLVPDAE